MSSPNVVALIPARLAATRLPDKPLVDIAGKTMIQHVWERVSQVRGVTAIAIATPDSAIQQVVESFGGQAIMTSHEHRSGTDRLAEAARILELEPDDIVINIQGDEPLLEPANIEAALAPLLEDPALPMSSLTCPCPEIDRDNPACVKVVFAPNGDALYFSRSRIPFPRDESTGVVTMQHIGLYAYRNGFLQTYSALAPTPLEQTEGLEQLRALENGYRIRMVRIEKAPIGVDTPEDLARVRALFENSFGLK
ncbi:3-deoxy-manno-octulosonate cytidylyltransferase [Armatimonadota bacterium]|nr:3-deoxy-manno-octulosonate cytidylyltransferase [Armatimonadota bacterium]